MTDLTEITETYGSRKKRLIPTEFTSIKGSLHGRQTMDDQDIITTLKILIIGESGVGKSR